MAYGMGMLKLPVSIAPLTNSNALIALLGGGRCFSERCNRNHSRVALGTA
jgi:transporter family protein